MTERKKIKLSDQFFESSNSDDLLSPRSEEPLGRSSVASNVLRGRIPRRGGTDGAKRPITDAEAMDIILGVGASSGRPHEGVRQAQPRKRKSLAPVPPAPTRPASPQARRDPPVESKGAPGSSTSSLPAAFGFAFELTIFVFRALTLPFWMLFSRPPGAGRRD